MSTAASSGVNISEPSPVDKTDYLWALDRLRATNKDAYETVLNFLRGKLLLTYRAVKHRADYPTAYIAHAALMQQAAAHALEEIIDDMERTTDKTTAPKQQEPEEDYPAGVLAGS